MKRRWRDRCCSIRRSLPFAVVAFLLLVVLHEPPRAHAFVPKDHGCQTRRGAGNRRSQRLFTFLQNAGERTFGGRDDESDRGSHSEILQPYPRLTPKKTSSGMSHSSSSLKFRNMQDLLDSLSSPNETLLIVFTATNCGPCKLQKQELSEFRQRLTNEQKQGLQPQHADDGDSHDMHSPSDVPLKMLAIDTEKWPHVGLAWFKVSKLPCVVVLRNKQVVARMEGLTRAKDLLDHVRPHLLP